MTDTPLEDLIELLQASGDVLKAVNAGILTIDADAGDPEEVLDALQRMMTYRQSLVDELQGRVG